MNGGMAEAQNVQPSRMNSGPSVVAMSGFYRGCLVAAVLNRTAGPDCVRRPIRHLSSVAEFERERLRGDDPGQGWNSARAQR